MTFVKARIIKTLVTFFAEDYRRINHALEVLKHSEKIIETEKNYDFDIVVAVALLHDVGIKPSELEHGYNNGKYQEQYGPPAARDLLSGINFPEEKIRIVCDIIGNHHSKSNFDYPELRILKEADRMVNKEEMKQKPV